MYVGTVTGGAITLLLIKSLSYVVGAIVTAIAITILLFALTELSNPRLLWLCVGASMVYAVCWTTY
jgi:hypothetical protein